MQVKRHIEKRECPNCGKIWEVTSKSDTTKNMYYRFCKECVDKLTPWERKVIRKSKDEEFNKKYLEQKRKDFETHIESYILNRARLRAEKVGLEFNLDISDIVIPEICPILEVPIQLGNRDDYEYSPSIDRIDNSKGYVKGNVQIISKKANSMKNSASYKELQNFCKNVLRYSLNSTEKECTESKDKEPLS